MHSAPEVTDASTALAARLELLEAEKALTRQREDVARRRRALPWVAVEKQYEFDTEQGRRTLAELFGDKSQLFVQHFMFGPDWDEGCPSCSFWADSFDGTLAHLAARDVAFVAVSRAPLANLIEYRTRMGWSFPWVSSADSSFNFDFGVSFTEDEQAGTGVYNYRDVDQPGEELPGFSFFARDDSGKVFHTYSTYARGLDPMNAAYQILDLAPKGRDEQDLPWSMAWLRRHDSYDDAPSARG